MKRILVAPFHSAGHVFSHLAVAQALTNAGYKVYFYAIKQFLQYARVAGCVPVESPNIKLDVLRFPPPQDKDERRAWWHSVPEVSAVHLLDVLRRKKVDAVVADAMHLGPALAAERLGIPWASLSTAPGFLQNWPKLGPQSAMDGLREKLGLPKVSNSYAMQCISPSLVLLPWMREFDTLAAPPQAVHVGNMEWDPAPGDRPRWIVPFTRERTVLVTTTSVSVNLPEYSERYFPAALSAIEAIGAKGVVTAAPAKLPPTLRWSKRIRVEGLVPHGWLFPRVRAIVAAGGWCTISRALTAGIPIVVVPLPTGLDQELNGALCERLGVGFSIPISSLSPESLRERLELLLPKSSPQSRRVRDYARRVRALDPPRAVVRAISGIV